MHKQNLINHLDNAGIYQNLLIMLNQNRCFCSSRYTAFVCLYYDLNGISKNSYITIRCKNCHSDTTNSIKLDDKDIFYLKCTNRI